MKFRDAAMVLLVMVALAAIIKLFLPTFDQTAFMAAGALWAALRRDRLGVWE